MSTSMSDTPDVPYMSANGHVYTWNTRFDRDCLDSCPCKHQPPGGEPYGRAEDYAGEQWDD